MKKILIIIFSLILLFTLYGCNSNEKLEFNEKILDNNIFLKTTIYEPLNVVSVIDVTNYTVVNSKYYHSGFIFVKDEMGRLNSLSLFKNKLMFEFEDNLILDVIDGGSGYYVKKTTIDNKVTVYDAYGNTVLPKDNYSKILIEGTYDKKYDSLGKIESRVYHEIIYYSFIGKENEEIRKEYIINPEDKTRIEIIIEEAQDNNIIKPEKIDLKEIGLDGYFLKKVKNILYIYKENSIEEKDSIYNIINTNDFDKYQILDGKLLYQKKYLVSDDSKDYSYTQSGIKYKIITYSIDLLSGDEKEIETNYLINNIVPFYDEEGIVVYAYAQIQFIEGKSLNSSEYDYIIINSEGKMVNQVGVENIDKLIKLSKDHYYNGTFVLNSKLEPLLSISNLKKKFIYSENLIITDVALDSNYGAIDYDGNIVIPFEYRELSDQFLDGKTYGVHNNGKKYIIDLFNNKTEIDISDQFLTAGLFYSSKYNDNKSKYEGRIYDYNNNTINSFEYLSLQDNSFKTGITYFGNYIIGKFVTGVDTYKYVVIDGTMVGGK